MAGFIPESFLVAVWISAVTGIFWPRIGFAAMTLLTLLTMRALPA